MTLTTPNGILSTLLPEWHLLLQGWSADGSLVAAAQEALLLQGEPPPGLKDLATQWASGNFSGIPPIVLLSPAEINGAMGAYAISTGTIYLNADWLAGGSKEQVFSVLTEELGHHLDGILNAVDTTGDEGEYFSRILSGVVLTEAQKAVLRAESDSGIIQVEGKSLEVDYSLQSTSIQPIAQFSKAGDNFAGRCSSDGTYVYLASTTAGVTSLSKYDLTGIPAWEKNLDQGGAGPCSSAIAADGSILIASGSDGLSGKSSTLARFSSTGEKIWEVADSNQRYGWDIAVNGDTVYVSGGTGTGFNNSNTAFINAYSLSTGSALWSKAYPNSGASFIGDLEISNGKIYCAAALYGKVDFDTAIAGCIDLNGNEIWWKTAPAPDWNALWAVRVVGNQLIGTGYKADGGDRGDTRLMSFRTTDGTILWDTSWGDNNQQGSGSIEEFNGKIYVAYGDGVPWNSSAISGGYSAVAELDTSGNLLNTYTYNVPNSYDAAGRLVKAGNSLFLLGQTTGGISGQTNGGGYDIYLASVVKDINGNPTDITPSSSTFNENIAPSTAVATFTTTDPDSGDTFIYSLVSGTGSTDNSAYTISGDKLLINATPNYEAKSSYSIRVRTTDAGGLYTEKAITFGVNDVKEAIRGNSLYTIVNGPSWTQAEANSVVFGGHLVSVQDAEENLFIGSIILATGTESVTYWIGLTDSAVEGEWEWSSGESLTYTNWSPGEPNAFDQVAGPEDYAALYATSTPSWFDISNGNEYFRGRGFQSIGIAEVPLQLSITRQGEVKEGAGLFTTSINLSAGTLASGNLAEGVQVWWKITGITADDLVSGDLSGNGIITNGKLEIHHSLKVDSDAGEKFEVSVFSDAGLTQQIGTTSSLVVQESKGVIRANSLYTVVNGPNWTTAAANSVALGGQLVCVGDQDENEFLRIRFNNDNSLKESLYRPEDPYNSYVTWIGLSYDFALGDWFDTQGNKQTYFNWFPPFQDPISTNYGALQVSMLLASNYPFTPGSWDDSFENQSIPYYRNGITEIPLSLSITRQGEVKEGSGLFTTSINLSAGTLASGNLAEGAQVWWKVTGITADDLVSGALSGTGTIQNGKLDLHHSLKVDSDTGDKLEVSVYSDASMTSEYQISTQSSVAVQEKSPAIRANSLYKIASGPTWEESEANSIALGGHLITINNAEENAFIANSTLWQLDRDGSTFYEPFFLGQYYDINSSTRLWSSGETTSYTNWMPGTPYDYPHAVYPAGAHEYYTSMPDPRVWGGQWDDIYGWINNKGYVGNDGIAEISLSLSITRQGEVKEGGGLFTTSINLSAGAFNRTDLVEGAQVWWKVTGITADDLVSGALSGTGTIQNGKLDIQHSLAINTDLGESFEVTVYSDASMTSEYQIGTKSSVAISESTVVRGNSLYTIVDGPSWTQAEANSVKLGGHLTTVNSAGEDTYLQKIFKDDIGSGSTPKNNFRNDGLWIGLTDQDQEGVWRWVSGDESSYRNPTSAYDDVYGGQDYMVLVPINVGRVDAGWYWDSQNAQSSSYDQTQHRGIAETSFIRRGDSAYVIVQGPTWEEAEANAVKLGGHLVTINDAAENLFLTLNFKSTINQAWIGLTDKGQEGLFRWISDENVSYTNYASGEPNNEYYSSSKLDADFISIYFNNKNWILGLDGIWADLPNSASISEFAYLSEMVGLAEIKLAANSTPTGTPTLSGTLKGGQVITIDRTPIQDADNFTGYTPTYNYSFEVSNDNGTTWTKLTSTDATDNSSTYTLTTAEVGKKVRGVVSYLDGYGTNESVNSIASNLVIQPSKSQWLSYSGQATDEWSGGIATFSNGDVATAFSVSKANGASSVIVQRLNANGAIVWSLDIGADYAPSAGSVLVSTSDTVYVTGGTKKGVSGESGLNDSDIFAAAISSSGQKLWYKNYGIGIHEIGSTAVIDANENILLEGRVSEVNDAYSFIKDVPNFYGAEFSGGWRGFQLRINPTDGSVSQAYTTGSGNSGGGPIAIDRSRNIAFIAGYTFGAVNGVNTVGNGDPNGANTYLIARNENTGAILWTRMENWMRSNVVSQDAENAVYFVDKGNLEKVNTLTGQTIWIKPLSNTTYVLSPIAGGGVLLSESESSGTLAIRKFDSSGTETGSQVVYHTDKLYPRSFIEQGDGTILISGSTPGAIINVPAGTIVTTGKQFGIDSFILQINSAFSVSTAANQAPTDLTLSASSFNENIAAGSTIATLGTTDPDSGDTFSYALVSGTGSTDNAAFSIAANQLKINTAPDFESKSSYSIRIRSTDAAGLSFEKVVALNVSNGNETPTDLTLSASSFNENIAAGSTIATLGTTDPDGGDTFSYALVTGTGSTDNAAFSISGNQLKIKDSPDFETKSSYSVRLRTTDAGGLVFDKAFVLTVTDLPEGPTAIESVGRTILRKSANSQFMVQGVEPGSAQLPISKDGTQIYAGIYGNDWTVLAAEQINGVNQVLWRNTSVNRLHVWALDANWSWTSSAGWDEPTSAAGQLLESQFGIDLDGNGTVATIKQVVEDAGSVRLSLNDGKYWAEPIAAGAAAVPIRNAGVQIYTNIYGPQWQVLAAETVGGVNQVLWRETSVNRLHIWSLDDAWNRTASSGLIDPDSAEALQLESAFQQDLNGDGVIAAPSTAVESAGSIQLLKGSGNRYSVQGTTPGAAAIAISKDGTQIYAGIYGNDWTVLAAETVNGVNQVLWKNTSANRLHVWTLDANWNWTSSEGWDDTASSRAIELESQFGIDLNADGKVAQPSTSIEEQGSIWLIKGAGNTYSARSTAAGSTPAAIKKDGVQIAQGIYGSDWSVLAAETINGVNQVLWKNTSANRLHLWTLDANWSWKSSAGWDEPNSAAGQQLEAAFGIDLDGNGTISAPSSPSTTIENKGDITLLTGGSNSAYSILQTNAAGALPVTIKKDGADIYKGIYGNDWSVLAAETINDINQVLWKNTSANRLHVWTLDANWFWKSSAGWDEPNSAAAQLLESQFGIDLDGNGTIANPESTIESAGATRLISSDSNRAYSAIANAAGSSAVPIRKDGAQIYAGIYGNDWTVLAAETINGVNQVLWKNTGANRLHVWTLDANWNWTSSTGWDEPSSTAGQLLESQFGIDLDGNGTIAAPSTTSTTIESKGDITLLKGAGNRYSALSTLPGSSASAISNGGTQIYDGIYGNDWTVLAADTINGINQVLWRNTAANRLHTWNLDTNWNRTSSSGLIDPASHQAHELEAQFALDLNGDGILRSWKPGTTGVDLLTGNTTDQVFSPLGVPASGGVDQIITGGGRNQILLANTNGSGNLYATAKDADYLLIDGFNPSNDQLLVASGKSYGTASLTLGSTSGIAVFEDRNADAIYSSSSDDLLALLKGVTIYPSSSLVLAG